MNDLVVVLPGILGSVLEKEGRVVWDASIATAWAASRSRGGSPGELRLVGDDGKGELAPDGVVATKLIDNFAIIPGFWKVDAWHADLIGELGRRFDLVEVAADDPRAGNLVTFPYDWRRDVRATARRLARVVERKLGLWRAEAGTADSRAILIAHGLGGLVARYALECQGLWRSTRALITFGTPFGGSPRVLNYVINGYGLRKLGIRSGDALDVVRSFPSAYQLIPHSPTIATAAGLKRASELVGQVPGLVPAMMSYHSGFHAELDAAIERNAHDEAYLRASPRIFVEVGIGQETLFGFRAGEEGAVSAVAGLPGGFPADLADGDGMVPRRAAIPLGPGGRPLACAMHFVAQMHESLPRDDGVLTNLIATLNFLQVGGPFRGDVATDRGRDLGVEIADAIPAGEPVAIRARAVAPPGEAAPELEAVIAPADGGAGTGPVRVPLVRQADGWWAGAAAGLLPGAYRAMIRGAGMALAQFGAVMAGFLVVTPGDDAS